MCENEKPRKKQNKSNFLLHLALLRCEDGDQFWMGGRNSYFTQTSSLTPSDRSSAKRRGKLSASLKHECNSPSQEELHNDGMELLTMGLNTQSSPHATV